MLEKGIIIFALGHPFYGRYAFNLAVTIKTVESIPIAVVYDKSGISHLDETQLSVFDYKIQTEVKAGCGSKLYAYDLSPFEKTILLDADMIWLPRHTPTELFTELSGHKFSAISEGSTDKPSGHYFFWANIEEIRDKYKVDKVHQFRTEVMYFEKCEEIKKMFDDAKNIHDNSGLDSVKEFAGGVPDEMAINIAAAVNKIEPHKENWQPSYWAQLFRNQVPEPGTLYRDYYLLSCGGNHSTENVKKLYNNIVKAQAPKLGLSHCFPVQSKHSFLENRRKS